MITEDVKLTIWGTLVQFEERLESNFIISVTSLNEAVCSIE